MAQDEIDEFGNPVLTRRFIPFTIAQPNNVSIGITSTPILSANPERKYAAIINDSGEVVYLSLGSAAILNKGIRLNPRGGVFEITAANLFRGNIYGITATTNNNVTVTEGI